MTCTTCGSNTASPTGLCPSCWHDRQAHLADLQRRAVLDGIAALNEGRPILWIHGRPYADPATD